MQAPLWRAIHSRLDPLDDLTAASTRTLVAEPPLTLADGGAIANGIDAELDELRTISTTGRQSIAAIEERERARTGINSLKVRYNSVFGYYIEITKANLGHAPADYERKQTLVNAERFTTPELKEYERKDPHRARPLHRNREAHLRRAAPIRPATPPAASAAPPQPSPKPTCSPTSPISPRRAATSRPGSPTSPSSKPSPRAIPSSSSGWKKHAKAASSPTTSTSTPPRRPEPAPHHRPQHGRQEHLSAPGRHAGPLAQMGSFVPADSLRFGLVDRIYTRIGASDNVARGRSTFMVEMTETATILNTATSKSLILLDEMGRGTATFDGLSLAWATVEYLHAETGARTLFATHYHELTLLAEKLPRVRNLRVGVKEAAGGIVFLHTIEPGAASKSYGIEVARLAGLPSAVIERAKRVLRQHEKAERQSVQVETAEPMQMTIFTPLSQRIVDRIEATDVNSLTPLQALNLLEELQQELKEKA